MRIIIECASHLAFVNGFWQDIERIIARSESQNKRRDLAQDEIVSKPSLVIADEL